MYGRPEKKQRYKCNERSDNEEIERLRDVSVIETSRQNTDRGKSGEGKKSETETEKDRGGGRQTETHGQRKQQRKQTHKHVQYSHTQSHTHTHTGPRKISTAGGGIHHRKTREGNRRGRTLTPQPGGVPGHPPVTARLNLSPASLQCEAPSL